MPVFLSDCGKCTDCARLVERARGLNKPLCQPSSVGGVWRQRRFAAAWCSQGWFLQSSRPHLSLAHMMHCKSAEGLGVLRPAVAPGEAWSAKLRGEQLR